MAKEKSDSLTIFDYYKNIIKKEPILSREEVEKSFDIIGMNRLFSYDKLNVLLANEVNDFLLDKYTVYLFYYYGVDGKKFVPFLNMKKERNEDKERLMKLAEFLFPEYSEVRLAEAIEVLRKVLSDVQLADINNPGGIQKEKKK